MTIENRHKCKDCKAEAVAYSAWRSANHVDGEEQPPSPPRTIRSAPHKGPRCASHHRKVTRERKAANAEKRVQNLYGLKPGQYAQLYEFQLGACAICRRATGASRRLSVDHNHESLDVRGLLCRPDNTLLGHARDNIEFFKRAIAYLEDPPFKRMLEGRSFDGE